MEALSYPVAVAQPAMANILSNKARRTDIHEVLVEPALENPIC